MFKRSVVLVAVTLAAFGQTRSRLADYALVLEDEPVARGAGSRAGARGGAGGAGGGVAGGDARAGRGSAGAPDSIGTERDHRRRAAARRDGDRVDADARQRDHGVGDAGCSFGTRETAGSEVRDSRAEGSAESRPRRGGG